MAPAAQKGYSCPCEGLQIHQPKQTLVLVFSVIFISSGQDQQQKSDRSKKGIRDQFEYPKKTIRSILKTPLGSHRNSITPLSTFGLY